MFLSELHEFPSAPYLAGGEGNLMTARVSILLKSRASLTCFRACFLPGRANDLSAPRYISLYSINWLIFIMDTLFLSVRHELIFCGLLSIAELLGGSQYTSGRTYGHSTRSRLPLAFLGPRTNDDLLPKCHVALYASYITLPILS